jgi:hypothetical protein
MKNKNFLMSRWEKNEKLENQNIALEMEVKASQKIIERM